MHLFSVDAALVERYLESDVLSGADVTALMERRAISDGTAIYLDDETMLPIEPLNSWSRSMSYACLDATTRKDYGRIIARLDRPDERGALQVSALSADNRRTMHILAGRERNGEEDIRSGGEISWLRGIVEPATAGERVGC